MPKKVNVPPEFFLKRRVSVFDCLLDKSAWEFDLEKDFPRAKSFTNAIPRLKEWVDNYRVGVSRVISANKKILTAVIYEPTPEELAAMAVRVERRRVKALAKKLEQPSRRVTLCIRRLSGSCT